MIKKNVKRFISFIVSHKIIARRLIMFWLHVHNYAYVQVGRLVAFLEPDRVHPKHRLMRYHDWFVSKIHDDWEVLDVGCGYGPLAASMAKKCIKVVGIDIRKENISRADKEFNAKNLDYICGDATTFTFKHQFNAIVLSNVLEHIDKRVVFLQRLSQTLLANGVFLIRIPLITRDWISMYKKEIGVEWKLDKTHFTEYSNESFFDEIAEAGLAVEKYEVQFGELYSVCVLKTRT